MRMQLQSLLGHVDSHRNWRLRSVCLPQQVQKKKAKIKITNGDNWANETTSVILLNMVALKKKNSYM
jgi:hypothetical protein